MCMIRLHFGARSRARSKKRQCHSRLSWRGCFSKMLWTHQQYQSEFEYTCSGSRWWHPKALQLSATRCGQLTQHILLKCSTLSLQSADAMSRYRHSVSPDGSRGRFTIIENMLTVNLHQGDDNSRKTRNVSLLIIQLLSYCYLNVSKTKQPFHSTQELTLRGFLCLRLTKYQFCYMPKLLSCFYKRIDDDKPKRSK